MTFVEREVLSGKARLHLATFHVIRQIVKTLKRQIEIMRR